MRDAVDVVGAIRSQTHPASRDGWIAALAERQHGVVSRRQLLALGIDRDRIARRLAQGRLHRVHRGVYAVGHRVLSVRGRWMAAVLAAGPGAVLSHRAAATLHDIAQGGAIEVTVPQKRRRHHGFVTRTATLATDEITEVDGIPVTTVARTLLDLAAVWPAHRVERAAHEAELRRLTSPTSLAALLDRYPRRKGTPALRRIVALGAQPTRSELESRFLSFLDDEQLPRPSTNAEVEAFEVDCLWRAERVIVELDGHATHVTRSKFERDRARDRALQIAGWRVIRITWRQLHEEAGDLAADLRALLQIR